MQSQSTFQDQTLTCRDCGKQFVWTAGEQEFYKQKGFDNPPSRCPDDRTKKKEERMQNRQMTKITCSNCGRDDEVPFVPRKGTPVLCRECFANKRQTQAA
ncbi:zinc-binding protein [Candidatus Gottesmanbacteria bacterium RIFCSPHIGHO2_02_FULL_39_14]|uniref:Zinc-binding protein n=3 Tax=Candidatus Gottesmaniibacteriota TaxID=1752720 RepID=A0A1F5ZYX5_9BACT|nr:MAG: zinc-binding protein [Candidatus Gottesmanbacteria bacterium RBG_16_38_7b]OGG17648.1 MAG: zinc-binding protein [Candidatus Gottesmanbacteria bacterium RIFCSPHIGHO2_02_FULL_39_14]OGG32037.1 MAG: zinc-binding protein [Candidatus Gottesmanbacteria bacterium RIFCSPLOWO2_02_FULL_38_8]